jgi:ribosomal protein S18 acetylase RimI-like enzyme
MSEITVRPARTEDHDAVLAFCAHTWAWGDYIELVWDTWLNDPEGLLLVAVIEERPVGLVHIRLINNVDAWQEGMRVDPAYRRQGIARRLSMEAGVQAMRRGATTVRLLTESTNTASVHMIDQARFRRVGAFALYTARPQEHTPRSNAGLEEPILAVPADLEEVVAYLNVSSLFPAVGGLYYEDFVGYRISDTLLAEKIQAGQVYLLRRWNRLDGLAIVPAREDWRGRHLFIGYIDGTTEAISLIAYALRRQIVALEFEHVAAAVPDLIMVRDAFAGAEYEWGGDVFYTYERGLDQEG